MVTLLYFAGLKERLGIGRETVAPPVEVRSVGEMRDWLRRRGGVWADALAAKNLQVAVNRSMTTFDAAISDGDEVAIFPPVTGG